MSEISPCQWFDGEAAEAAKFYVSLLPNSRIERVQKNVRDSPGGKAGTVLVVDFTLAGQRFMALNGGTRFEYTHCHIVQGRLRRSGGGRPAVGRPFGRRFDRAMRLAQGPLRRLLADRAGCAPGNARDRDPAKAQRMTQAMLQMIKLDIAGLKRAYEGA
jgi:hypothetical protein